MHYTFRPNTSEHFVIRLMQPERMECTPRHREAHSFNGWMKCDRDHINHDTRSWKKNHETLLFAHITENGIFPLCTLVVTHFVRNSRKIVNIFIFVECQKNSKIEFYYLLVVHWKQAMHFTHSLILEH